MKRLINEIKIELAMIALGVTLCVSSKVYAKSVIIPTPTTTPNTPITTTTDSNISKATLDIINTETSVIHIYNTETEPEINNAVTNTITNNNTTTPTQPTTSAKTEEQVIAKINELKAKYPENSQWETSDIYNSSYEPSAEFYNNLFYDSMTAGQGTYKSNMIINGKPQYAKDCAAWAMWVSDQIFGNAPTTKHSNYNAIKVGDLIHEGDNSTNGSHWSVVVGMGYNDMNEKYYIVTDSDDTRYVNWETHTLAEWCYNPDYPRNEIMNNYLGEYGETGVPFQVYSRY